MSTEPNHKVLELATQALSKHEEIRCLHDRKNTLIRQLHEEALRFEQLGEPPQDEAGIGSGSRKCIAGILRELKACLNAGDLGFHGMKEAKSNLNVQDLIGQIQNKLSERAVSDILNSKHFNLGCSEPLLLFDILGDDLQRPKLANAIAKKLSNDRLEKIIVQLHSTKTPCISCLIGCCGYCRDGVIKSLFEKLGEKIRESLGKDNVALHFLISYHAPYEDEYPFYAQVTREWAVSPGSYLIVNMRLYDPQFKKMKERIVKEERLRLKRIYDEKGTITPDDLPTAFP